jgi:hypothetical protein
MPRGNTQFDKCVRGVKRSGSAVDPRAVCGAQRAKRLKGNRRPEIGSARLRQPKSKRDYSIRWAGQDIGNIYAESKAEAVRKWREQTGHTGKIKAVERRNPRSAVPKKVLEGHRAIWGGTIPPGARAQLEKEYARDKMKRKGGKRKNRGRRNPLDGALATYEGFHGRPSEEIVEVTTELHEHSHLAGLGDLVKLVIVTDNGAKVIIQKFEDGRGNPAILCMNERPKNGEYKPQLFIEGGDQSVRLSDFGIFEPYHEIEVLGRCRNVYYYTRKDHLGSDGGTATYNHKFGGMREVKGRGGKVRRKRSPLPTVLYDTRNRLLSFAGGGYTIPDEGIDN